MHGLKFLTPQYDLNSAFVAQYDYLLVILSYLIACLAAYTAWNMATLYQIENESRRKIIWVGCGGFVMGCGIWAMHFVAMLAYELPVAINYDIVITLISVLPAIIASTLAISIIGKAQLTLNSVILGSVLFGAGIGTMHYVGMAAMRVNAVMVYDSFYFTLSIFVAVALAFVSLKLKSVTEQYSSHLHYSLFKLASISMMGAAVAGMHYTGMAAVHYFPIDNIDPALTKPHDAALATMVIILVVLIMLLTIAVTMFERRIRNALLTADTSRERMFNAIDNISDGFVLFDSDDRLILHNEHYKKMYGEIGEWIKPGVSYKELLEKRAEHADKHISEKTEDYINDRLLWHEDPNEHFIETLNDGRHVFGKEKRSASGDIVGIWTDISDLKKVEGQLKKSNQQIQMILDVSPSPIIIRSIEGDILLYVNQSANEYFNKNNFRLKLNTTDKLINQSDYIGMRETIIDKGFMTNREFDVGSTTGEEFSIIMSGTLINYNNEAAVMLSFVDISAHKHLENRLRELAQTDSLTGISNRRFFSELGGREINRCQRNKLPLAMLMLDIDKFKLINDQYGHDVGDQAIIQTTKICNDSIRDTDIIGRMGGEEFAIILPDKGLKEAQMIAERIRKKIEATPMTIYQLNFSFTISIGISILDPDKQDSIQTMLIRADEKLYQAKNNGRNQIAFI